MVQRGENADSDALLGAVPQRNEVKVLFVGDSGSGKTSIIHSLINDKFDHNLPPRLDDIIIPAEVTPDRVPIHITDYSQRDKLDTNDRLAEATDAADVICIVYVAGEHSSLDRVAQYWIPMVRRFNETRGLYRPIILVANKIDLLPESSLSEGIATLKQIFLDVEAHIEVSALTQRNVVELFSAAQKAITYPISPLFDTQARTLTRGCREVLTRIFKMNDLDKDGLLNDKELNMFQEKYFGVPLQPGALNDLKQIIKQSAVDGIENNSVSLTGFLFIHQLSIEQGRRDFTWLVIRKFNDDNQIELQATDDEIPSMIVTDLDRTNKLMANLSLDGNVDSFTNSKPRSLSTGDDCSSSYLEDESVATAPNARKSGRELLSSMDFPWMRHNPNLLKAGLGITVTTFISFIALRYLKAARG